MHEIIGPPGNMDMPELLQLTRMTGDMDKAMRACPQPILAAVDGVCTGAGAMIARACDIHVCTARSKLAFLFESDAVLSAAAALANELADGPNFGHATTKAMLWQEWSAGLGECNEAEAQAQAICMKTNDFERAYHAFAARQRPVFEGD